MGKPGRKRLAPAGARWGAGEGAGEGGDSQKGILFALSIEARVVRSTGTSGYHGDCRGGGGDRSLTEHTRQAA